MAELAKFTLLIFYPTWLVLWIVYRIGGQHQCALHCACREGSQFICMMVLSVLVVNAGYGFEGSFQRLGQFRFQTMTLTGRRRSEKCAAQRRKPFCGKLA